MCCLGHSAFIEHVITHTTEHLKLFLTGESICLSTGAHDLEHLTLGGDHVINLRKLRRTWECQDPFL